MKKHGSQGPERILDIWVQPRASRNEILGYRHESLRIRLTAAPEAGAANRLCRQVLAEALGVAPSRVEIVSGHRARRKRVRITGGDPGRWEILIKDRKESR